MNPLHAANNEIMVAREQIRLLEYALLQVRKALGLNIHNNDHLVEVIMALRGERDALKHELEHLRNAER